MKTNKNTNKVMSALQFMKEFENTQKIMESIADATANERKALMESAMLGQPSVDNNGVFDMDSLLDVEVSDKPENQPRYYNSPIEPLSDSDKALIVDEFAKKLSTLQKDVIDFSEVGPIATVIKDNFGFKQDVEKFLQDTIQKTANWMKEQNKSEAEPEGVTANTDGGPTDIAPTTSGVDGGAGIEGGIPPLVEVPELTDTVADAEAIIPPEPAMGDDGMDMGLDGAEGIEDLGDGTEGIEGDEGLEAGIEGDEAIEGDDGFEAIEGDEGDEAIEGDEGDDDGTEGIEGDEGTEPEIEDETSEEVEETDDEEDEEKLLESIKTDYLKSRQVITESINVVNKEKQLTARLESISGAYHARENAKIEAVRQEKQLKVQLESIANTYKAGVKAKFEAVAKEKKIDNKLNQLLESHKQKTSNDGKSNLTARLEAKEKIEKLTK